MWREEANAPTRSILRVASTQSTRNTTSKRVTFADELLHIMYTSPRKPRPPPPSTVPPVFPQSPGLSVKTTPRSPRSPRSSRPVNPTPRNVTRSPRKQSPLPQVPLKHSPDLSPRRLDTARRRPPDSPRLRLSTSARPRAENPRSRVDNLPRPNSPNPADTSLTSSGRSTSPHRRHHRHGCHRCGRRERRERRRRERERAPSPIPRTDVSVMGSEASPPTQRADRVARERRKYDAGVVKRRTSPEQRRESRVRSAGSPASRQSLAEMRQRSPPNVEGVGEENIRANTVRRSRNDAEPRSAESPKVPERTRPNRTSRKSRNSDERGSELLTPRSDVTGRGRRRRSDRMGKERKRREDREEPIEVARQEARMKSLRTSGALTKARRFVAKSLALTRDGYPPDMLDLIEARTIFKLYLRCRERTRKGDDLLVEAGQRLEEAQLRKKMMEEEAELKELGRELSSSELSDAVSASSDRKVMKKKKSGLQHFVADELGSSLSSMRGLSRGQLDRAVLAAAIARADRFETHRYDGASYY